MKSGSGAPDQEVSSVDVQKSDDQQRNSVTLRVEIFEIMWIVMHSSPSPVVEFGFPSTQMCVPSSPEGYSAKSEVSLDVAVSMHDVVLGPVWSSTLCKIFAEGYITGVVASPSSLCLGRSGRCCQNLLFEGHG